MHVFLREEVKRECIRKMLMLSKRCSQFWEIFELCILFDTSVEFVFLFSFKRTGVIKCN